MRGSNALREERKRRGWNQTALADLLGASRSTINRWEQGKAVPDHHFLILLCQLYRKTPTELGFTDEHGHLGEIIDPLIPLLSGPFIARDALMGVITKDLMALKNLALCGLPGIGKTALATALAYDQEVRSISLMASSGRVWDRNQTDWDCSGIGVRCWTSLHMKWIPSQATKTGPLPYVPPLAQNVCCS